MPKQLVIVGLLALAIVPVPQAIAQSEPKQKVAKPRPPTVAELRQQVAAQQKLIDEQAATIAALQEERAADAASIEEQRVALAALQEQLATLNARLDEILQQLPAVEQQKALEARLAKIEEDSRETPEIPPNVVSAGDFPGSIRIPGTDAAIKFGGRIRAAGVFTLSPLGSDDRFITNTIPVEPTDAAAGEGRRTNFSANTSRFNFEMRTPTGAGQMRAFIEGDFTGSNASGTEINFRLRHAYAQWKGFILGQTWSTFADPANAPLDLDFEGINGECNVRQPEIRYTAQVRDDLWASGAAENPSVSITGGEGVNVVPDLIGRTYWSFRKAGHLQVAVVLRDIRGETDTPSDSEDSVFGYGASISGVVPFRVFHLEDRFVFQLNAGKGIARYINDLASLGGQDAVFNPIDGTLHALPVKSFYLVYEHMWKRWQFTRDMNLRSAFNWSFVEVHNLDFQLSTAYKRTNRYAVNIVFSPTERIDLGIEYLYGTRENLDGHKGNADQIQLVGIFRF